MIKPNQTPNSLVLLIGGPADGRRVQRPDRRSVYYLPRSNRIEPTLNPRDPVEKSYISAMAEEYVQVERNVYAHSSIRDIDVIDALVSGYRCEIGQ